ARVGLFIVVEVVRERVYTAVPAIRVPWLSPAAAPARDMRAAVDSPRDPTVCVGNWYNTPMSLTLICPRCEGSTELRGTMDAWYLTWCPECERIWRVELRSLLDDDEPDDPTAPSPSARRTRSRARPST